MRGATVLRRSGWSPEMFAEGTQITDHRRLPIAAIRPPAISAPRIFPDGSSIDRYGQRRRQNRPAPAPTERPARLANGDPNIAGDWAAEQRVMTDPRGQRGTLVPVSVADSFEPGAVPEGAQAFPGARGTAISLADDPVDAFWNQRPSALPLTEAGKRAIEGFDGSSADNPRLRCAPTNILFDWTFEADINRITQSPERIKMLYGSMGHRANHSLEHDRASGREHAERRGSLDRPLGERRADRRHGRFRARHIARGRRAFRTAARCTSSSASRSIRKGRARAQLRRGGSRLFRRQLHGMRIPC